jgi:hypothetical protein
MIRRVLVLSALASTVAWGKPPGPSTFCAKYPSSPTCTGSQPACTYCHTSPPTRNPYGQAVEANLVPATARPLSDTDFQNGLPAALAAAEGADSDGDGTTNLVEIQKGTLPGDGRDHPNDTPCSGGANPSYNVCKYDYRYVYIKLRLDFCGGSPTYAEVKAFMATPDSGKAAQLDAILDTCLASEFWKGKNGQLWELGHKKIRPVGTLKAGPEEQGQIPLADYYDDYNLWAWSQTDDHDARDILTADFFVERSTNPTSYKCVAGSTAPCNAAPSRTPFQAVDLVHRSGNLTTAWTLAYNVMFTPLPRNAAAQAYRSYLGLDIAKQEGLYAINNEPQDYDAKGVTADLCKQCHATLDPLSYPFRNYNGLSGSNSQIGRYITNRLETLFPNISPRISQTPEAGYIFGKPVANLKEWGRTGADSDAFLVATVNDYWKLLMGGAPTAEQNAEFTQLWQRLRSPNNYSVKKMLHELIKTEAYGAP